jgi:hypothetical protein
LWEVVLPFLARRHGKLGEYDNVVAEIGKQVPIFSTMLKGPKKQNVNLLDERGAKEVWLTLQID